MSHWTVSSVSDSLQVKKAPASRTVKGNVGAGTGHVSVTTVSGAITLLRRAEQTLRAEAGMESETR
jgi:hypothetical protein